ncbi:MAG: glutamate--tRNA ligase [Pseudomonadota bacterium]
MIVTRFAPSPTGLLHIGNLRTALFNFLIARQADGVFVLRLDDTDPQRSTQEYVDAILEDMEWLGLAWDRIEKQSDRLQRYAAAADRMREMGRLYEAFETPTELELKRKKLLNMGRPPVYDRAALALTRDEKERLRAERGNGVWRFKLDRDRTEWTDGILGDVSIDAASVSDPVLIRADGQVLYTLASAVDDIEMGVSDIVRGADHVTNTATQIQLIEALGGRVPRFAHHALLTGSHGEALSKRLGTLSLQDLRAAGVEPMAVLSLMARLGSSRPVELQTSIGALVRDFDLGWFGTAPTKFDRQDLYPLTSRYLRELPFETIEDDLAATGVPVDKARAFWDAVRANIKTREDIGFWWTLMRDGIDPVIQPGDEDFVAQALALLPEGPANETTWDAWTETVKAVTGRKGRALFRPLRLALTGRDHGPEMAKILPLLQVIKAKGMG